MSVVKRNKRAGHDEEETTAVDAPSPLTGMEGAKNRQKIRTLLKQVLWLLVLDFFFFRFFVRVVFVSCFQPTL